MYNDSKVFGDKSDKVKLKRKHKENPFQQQKLRKNDQIQSLELKLHEMEVANHHLKIEIAQLSSCNVVKSLSINFDINFSNRTKYIIDHLKQSPIVRDNANSHRRSGFFIINASSYFFPIIYASPELLAITKYPMHEIIGQNCGFLCGPQTSRLERAKLNEALQEGRNISTILLNYRKDNTMFWNYLQLHHVNESNNDVEDAVFKPFMIVGYHTELNPYIDGSYELDPHVISDSSEHHIIKDIILRYKENGCSSDDLTSVESRNYYTPTPVTNISRQLTASNLSLLSDATNHSYPHPPNFNPSFTTIITPKAVAHVPEYGEQGTKSYDQKQPTTFYSSFSIDDLLKPIQSAAIISNTSISYKETSTSSLAALKEKLSVVTTLSTIDEEKNAVNALVKPTSSILTNLSKASAFTKVKRNQRFITSCTPMNIDTTYCTKNVSFDSNDDFVPVTTTMFQEGRHNNCSQTFVSKSPDHCFELSYLHAPNICGNSSSNHNNAEIIVTADNSPEDFEIFSEFLDSEEFDTNNS